MCRDERYSQYFPSDDLISLGKGCYKNMYKCLRNEVKGGFYPKFIRRLKDLLMSMTDKAEECLKLAIAEGMVPIDAVYQKVFSGDHMLFSIPVERRKYAQKTIDHAIEKIKCIKGNIQGTSLK